MTIEPDLNGQIFNNIFQERALFALIHSFTTDSRAFALTGTHLLHYFIFKVFIKVSNLSKAVLQPL